MGKYAPKHFVARSGQTEGEVCQHVGSTFVPGRVIIRGFVVPRERGISRRRPSSESEPIPVLSEPSDHRATAYARGSTRSSLKRI